MKSDAIAFGVAGVLFGLVAGWIIGSQQANLRSVGPAPQAATQPAAPAATTPPPLDESKVNAFRSAAERMPKDPAPRIELGNLYFDSERYSDAITWYAEGLKLQP